MSESTWHYISFADPHLPKGRQFLGAAIVEAPNFPAAIILSHILGCNPGGEALGLEVPSHLHVRPSYCNRLLSREEVEDAIATEH